MRIAIALRSARPTYTVLARAVPSSFNKALSDYSKQKQSINVGLAHKQHAKYLSLLQSLPNVTRVVQMPTLDHLPDSVFVEDVLVVVGKTVIVTRPGAPSRREEAILTLEWLTDHAHTHGLTNIVNLTNDQNIQGDVLQMGRDIFVGQSARTNAAAAVALQSHLGSDYHVRPVPVPPTTLHLKSIVTGLPNIGFIYHGASDVRGEASVKSTIQRYSSLPWYDMATPEQANVVHVGPNVLYNSNGHSGDDNLPQMLRKANVEASTATATEEGSLDEYEFYDMVDSSSEIGKADGALTCCSVIFQSEAD
eukprot:TRINITY_DN5449_c0_g2_i1.p1 TRINITY_DN5449_c0_g2~~TRINITY_DN5449_c0_g2_i1.p1  ORF type:complete len:307 (+),score=69.85 TRINITY_DN5449_c0_g2_i1:98-1018(+)